VSLANTQGLGLAEKRELNALVSAENSMRKQLYEEVAKALKIDPSQVNRVAEIFAKEWQKPAR
jgi:phage portal protein BeeE